MKFRKRRKMHSAIEAASLSDILFFLLLFFLMVSTMASPSAIQVLLPKAKSGEASPQKKIIKIVVDNGQNYYLDSKPVAIDNLKDELSKKVTYGTEVTVVLEMDKSVESGKMIEVIDLVNQLKLPIVIATEKK